MMTRLRILALATSAFVLFAASTGNALEKTTRLAIDSPDDAWRGGTTCTISYYNTCTGWLWVWSGWNHGDRVGVLASSCCGTGETAYVVGVNIFWATGAPAGYDFTGTVDIRAADANGCPTGAALGTQPMLPASGAFVLADFASSPVAVPSQFVVTYTFSPLATIGDPSSIGSEHPAAGPTGPQACGTCYPNNRTNHAFWYRTEASPLCPGSPFNDGICDAQLMWDIAVSCVTSVDDTSWGQIKNLYR